MFLSIGARVHTSRHGQRSLERLLTVTVAKVWNKSRSKGEASWGKRWPRGMKYGAQSIGENQERARLVRGEPMDQYNLCKELKRTRGRE